MESSGNREAERGARQFWRSLEELAHSSQFVQTLEREFPAGASEWLDAVDRDTGLPGDGELNRRNFLALMGASLALAGIGNGCVPGEQMEGIVPSVNPQHAQVPGTATFFATSLSLNGFAHGALIETHEGRPTKIEGNPLHPASLGATNVFMQAAILSLYDPERAQVVVNAGNLSTWDKFLEQIRPILDRSKASGGRGLRILSEPVISPTLAAQVRALREKFPQSRWHQWSPLDRNNARGGSAAAFGRPLNVVYHFDRAQVILALDSDFLVDEPGSLRYARQFVDARRVRSDRLDMNRLYVVESTRTITGAMADHRWPCRPDEIASIASSLLRGATSPDWLKPLLDDLRRAGTAALVVPGPFQPAHVHATCHQLNAALGAIGSTVTFTDPVEAEPVDSAQSMAELMRAMSAGDVEVLIIVGGNPAYTAPGFVEAMKQVAMRVHLSGQDDETSFHCHWHLPMSHELESWGDARAFDGTLSFVQPMISPLYLQTRSPIEFMSMILGDGPTSGYELVRSTYLAGVGGEDFESWWVKGLHGGLVSSSELPAQAVMPQPPSRPATASATAPATATTDAAADRVHIVFRPDPCVGDGSWANNGWLQELPKPITKLTWGNAALISPSTARRLALRDESTVQITTDEGRSVNNVPVLIVPGQPDGCVTLHLGYGRLRAGRVGTKHGVDAYAVKPVGDQWFTTGRIAADGGSQELARTQHHHLLHGRDFVRVRNITDYPRSLATHADNGHSTNAGHGKVSLDLYPAWDYSRGNKWGMVIDINACVGCNACVVACQSENNIPIVGKDQVSRGREMHWLRVDTYFASKGEEFDDEPASENPETYFQPVPCMHCEQAPCEVVCPVGATVHDNEGTNNMVYNRCIGTRYCSNNCPYKVRRFNWLAFNEKLSDTERMSKNPNVTVRSRGVMEKCTFCIQRIDRARIAAKKEDWPAGFVTGDQVQTACQQACPASAIVFGNLNDELAMVTKLKKEPANYGILEELNTKPRTTYLERFHNPNPAI